MKDLGENTVGGGPGLEWISPGQRSRTVNYTERAVTRDVSKHLSVNWAFVPDLTNDLNKLGLNDIS